MSYMFCDCNRLKELNLNNFDTSNVVKFEHMFDSVDPVCKIFVGDKWTLTEKQCGFGGKFIRG